MSADDHQSVNTFQHGAEHLDDQASRVSSSSRASGRFSALLSVNGLMMNQPPRQMVGIGSKAHSDPGVGDHDEHGSGGGGRKRDRSHTEGFLDSVSVDRGEKRYEGGGDDDDDDERVDYHPILRVGIDPFGRLEDEPELASIPKDVLEPMVQKLNEPNPAKLLANVTPFMDFLAEACGFNGMQLSACFAQNPHPDCSTYESYRPYLHELPRASITQTIGVLEEASEALLGRKLALLEALRIGGPPMKNALAMYCSGVMRSSAKANPHRSNITKQDVFHSLEKKNDGLEALLFALKRLKKSNHMRK